MEGLLGFWGKARPDAAAVHGWHPLLYHSLDVLAVGAALLELHHGRATREAAMLGWSMEELDALDPPQPR